MKRTLPLLSAILLVCTSCIPGKQYSPEDPRGYADRYYFTQSEKVCYLDPDGVVIYKADGVDTGLKKGGGPMVITARRQQIVAEWFSGPSGWRSGPLSILFEFEEGKAYRIGFSRDSNTMYITLVTDSKRLEIARSFMDKQQAYAQEMRQAKP